MLVETMLRAKGNAVTTASPHMTLADAVHLLTSRRIGALVLTEGERIVGIFTERDLVRAIALHGGPALDLAVADFMTREVYTCSPDTTAERLMALMTERRFRHVPVLVDEKLVGLVSIGDVVKSRLDEATLEVDSLRSYVMSS